MSAGRAKSKPNQRLQRGAMSAGRAKSLIRHRTWQAVVLLVAALVLSSCGWRGISNVPIPGTVGSGSGAYDIYVQVPDTLAINGNSKVMVADVAVGSIRAIGLQNWVATLRLGVDKSVKLPKNTLAKIAQAMEIPLSQFFVEEGSTPELQGITLQEDEIRFLSQIQRYSSNLSDSDRRLLLAMVRKFAATALS